MDQSESDFTRLIPELPEWNNGTGIDAGSWISCVGNYDLAIGYSLIFWPSFVQFEQYVLRVGFSESSLRGFERAAGSTRAGVEAVMNHLHIVDIHCNIGATEPQIRYLGRVLQSIYETKLAHDFPHLSFEVSFNDEAGLDSSDYEITFWQN